MGDWLSRTTYEEGGVETFDQHHAAAQEALRDADVVFLVAAKWGSEAMAVRAMIPLPENEKQEEWIDVFLDLVQKTFEEIREEHIKSREAREVDDAEGEDQDEGGPAG